MTMALDVVAFLERAMDDAIMTIFAGLYYPVTGTVIVGAGRTPRKRSHLGTIFPHDHYAFGRECPSAE